MDVASLLVRIGFSADSKPLEKIEQRLEGLNHKLRLIVGTEVVRKLAEMTGEFGHSALELENVAASAGLTTDAMQRLQYAVTQSGGNAGELGMTMTHLARQIYQAKIGGEQALQTFAMLGINSSQIASFRTTEDALYGVMDALHKTQDPLRRQALMDQALGQGSRGLGRFALAGRQAAMQAQKTAKQLGIIIPRATLDKLAQARTSMNSLSMLVKAVSSNVAGQFAPVIVHAVDRLEQFYVANKKIIDLTFEKWVVNASYAFGFFLGFMRRMVEAVAHFTARHDELIERVLKFGTAMIGLGVAAKAVGSGLGMVHSAASLLSGAVTLAKFAPMLLLFTETAAAVGAIVVGVHDLNELLFESHDIKQTWMYQALTGTGAIGAKIQGVMGTLLGASDMTGITNLSSDVSASPLVRGMHPGDPRLQALVQRASAGMQVAQNMSANIPPASIAAPGVTGPPVANGTVNVTNNITVTPPQGITADQSIDAMKTAVSNISYRGIINAMSRQMDAVLY